MATRTTSARATRQQAKPCACCDGVGGLRTASRATVVCPECLGTGWDRRNTEQATYIATCGTDVLDVGNHLERFVQVQVETWSELGGDHVVVWEVTDGGKRVIATLSPDREGRTVVWWQ